MLKKILYPLCFALCLTVFTLYLLLDTFVIEQVYTPLTTLPAETESLPPETIEPSTDTGTETTEEPIKTEPVITDNYYNDGNIEISIEQYREYDSDIYVANVKITSIEYLKTALAKNIFGKNIKQETSVIAKNNNAIFAVNGDFYGSQESGFVLKNGLLYRADAHKKQEDLVIFYDGTFDFFLETEVSAYDLYESNAYQILAFGPSLLKNGELTGSKYAPRGAIKKNNPRTAIGRVDDLHYMFVVCDGRTDASNGLTTDELAKFMKKLGCTDAYNLDGGGSATMYFNGRIVNNPTFDGEVFKERSVSDIVYIGY
ncbi:MAG: phosphodiester glycosidase family protein [Ruminococcaceae bacterium]|nr:phosphodiester glycosidase family protein [Oscillospiraceae bacterium]